MGTVVLGPHTLRGDQQPGDESPEHEFNLLLELYEAVATMRIIARTQSPDRGPRAAGSVSSTATAAAPQPLRPVPQASPTVPRRPLMTVRVQC